MLCTVLKVGLLLPCRLGGRQGECVGGGGGGVDYLIHFYSYFSTMDYMCRLLIYVWGLSRISTRGGAKYYSLSLSLSRVTTFDL